jgi:hypothetical protein
MGVVALDLECRNLARGGLVTKVEMGFCVGCFDALRYCWVFDDCCLAYLLFCILAGQMVSPHSYSIAELIVVLIVSKTKRTQNGTELN